MGSPAGRLVGPQVNFRKTTTGPRNSTQVGTFSARLAALQVAGGEPGQLGPVGYPELRVSPRKVHLDRIARNEQFPGDVGIAQASAGKLDQLTFNRTEADPTMRGARALPAAPLGVGDGLLER